MAKKIILLVFVSTIFSCSQPEKPETNTSLLYFDIKAYFEKESGRLQKLNPEIDKQVTVNGSSETKRMRIGNWKKELAIFVDADINKASWKGGFKVERTTKGERYTSSSQKIPVKSVSITKENDQIKQIEIIISNRNILYTSNDTLNYYPKRFYQIKKQQNIKFLKSKNYQITGKFE